MRAMQVIKEVLIPFAIRKHSHDDVMILLHDIVLELFEKIRDIYCVFDSLVIIHEQLLGEALTALPDFFSQSLVTKLIVSISSPNLHVP